MKAVRVEKKLNKDTWKLALFFFGFVVLYNFAVICKCRIRTVDEITYTYHVVDYSFGFVTKLLPGAIYHLFFKEVYPQQLTVYVIVLTLLVMAFAAFMLARLVTAQADAAVRKQLFILSLFFLSGPCTFAIFSYEPGMLDLYWLLFSALFLIFVSFKYLKWLIPAVFVLSLLVHFSSAISYLVFFGLILLYRISAVPIKNERVILSVILAVSVVLSLVLVGYFLSNEHANLVYTLEEFDHQLDLRNHSGESTYYVYYDYSLYQHGESSSISLNDYTNPLLSGNGAVATIINNIYFQVRSIAKMYNMFPKMYAQLVFLIVLLLPLYILFVHYWKRKIKSGTLLQKMVYTLCIIQFPFTAFFGVLFSPDVSRWLTHAFLIQFTLFLYIIHHEKEENVLNELFSHTITHAHILMYYLVYAVTFFKPYQ